MILAHYIVVPKGERARPAISVVRATSRLFKKQYSEGNITAMETTSHAAWNALTIIFETLRNAEDDGNLANSYMQSPTGFVIEGLTQAEQQTAFNAAKIDRFHSSFIPLTLRDALNKIAHHRSAITTFRIDGRGAHYLVLCGTRGNRLWAAEILVSRLCKNASIAANAIR